MDGDFRTQEESARRRAASAPLAAHPAPAPARAPQMPAHDVRALMTGGTQAQLLLDGVAYTLRITRAGKLILTK